MEKKPISRAGFDALMKELKQLQEIERPAIIEAVQTARAHGDLGENAEYSSARERQRHIDKRIRHLEEIIGNAQVIDISSLSGDRVTFGATVTVEDDTGNKMQCQLLSDIEADGKVVIACTSPFGRAVIGKCRGDTCVVRTPGGEKEYEILEVRFN
ncbi:MAG: transcription elongation factor GreA [Alphaproteobacteria bacterium]|nr:transcription elongation factor GreA [Alphaproteobacteria bacterium]